MCNYYNYSPRTYEKAATDIRPGDLIVRLPGHPTDEHIDWVSVVTDAGPTVLRFDITRFWTSPNRHPDRRDGLSSPEYVGKAATLQVTYPETDIVLAEMLTENTGRHFLDSGGAYGRHWERNRAAAGPNPVEYFRSRPEASQGWRGEEWATVDVFHYLRERVEYSHPLTRAYRMFVYLQDDRTTNGSATLREFLDAGVEKEWFEHHGYGGGYTYNHDNSLSQDIVWEMFQMTEENPFGLHGDFVAVSVHNGCDARGGFTDWKMFELTGYDGAAAFLDFWAYSVVWECDNRHAIDPNQGTFFPDDPTPERHIFTFELRHGDEQWYSFDGYDIDPPEMNDDDETNDDDPHGVTRVCPMCGDTLRIVQWLAPCAG